MGLLIGIAATVFGYSNLGSVNVQWSVFHIDGVPLWTVAVVPLALVVVAGTLYHWTDGLHHFTEHMRHRRRVHELEAEVASLRAHLDQILEMPDHSTSKLPEPKAVMASLPAADERIADLAATQAEPVPIEVSPPSEAPPAPAQSVDGSRPGHAPSTHKSRSAQRTRVRLEVAGEPRRPDRSGSDVEGMTGEGSAAEPEDSLEREA